MYCNRRSNRLSENSRLYLNVDTTVVRTVDLVGFEKDST